MIANVIKTAYEHEGKAELCDQAPSGHPEFTHFLVAGGIDSISVNPYSFGGVKQQVTQAKRGGLRIPNAGRPIR